MIISRLTPDRRYRYRYRYRYACQEGAILYAFLTKNAPLAMPLYLRAHDAIAVVIHWYRRFRCVGGLLFAPIGLTALAATRVIVHLPAPAPSVQSS